MKAGRPASEPGLQADQTERLMIEAAQQDPARFAELFEVNFHRVYAYIVRRVHDRDAAEDLTSEVFLQALASIQRFEWRGAPFAAWLFRIAANAIVDRSKRYAKETDLTALSDAELSVDDTASDLEESEQRGQLFQLVDRLPDDQRRVIVMRFVEQKSIREIAGEIGRSEGAVKQLQFRGLQTLKAQEQGSKHQQAAVRSDPVRRV